MQFLNCLGSYFVFPVSFPTNTRLHHSSYSCPIAKAMASTTTPLLIGDMGNWEENAWRDANFAFEAGMKIRIFRIWPNYCLGYVCVDFAFLVSSCFSCLDFAISRFPGPPDHATTSAEFALVALGLELQVKS